MQSLDYILMCLFGLGTMELDLSHMPKHSHSDRECSLDQLRPEAKRVSLLKHKKLRGWWPASAVAGDGNEQTRELTVGYSLLAYFPSC